MSELKCWCRRTVHNGLDCGVPIPHTPPEEVRITVDELAELRADRDRLNWLESRRLGLNKHYGTNYGWRFVASCNVNRLFVCDTNTIDLHDSEAAASGGTDIRAAIDRATQEASR